MQASGDSVTPMIATLMTMWLIPIPLPIYPAPDYRPGCVWSPVGSGSGADGQGNLLSCLFSLGQMEENNGIIYIHDKHS